MLGKYSLLISFLFLAFGYPIGSGTNQDSVELHTKKLTSLAYEVCHNTVLQSKQALFNIIDLHSNPSVQPLITLLHNSSVQTMLMNRPDRLKEMTLLSYKKNFIFFVKDVGEALSVILHSSMKHEALHGQKKFIPRETMNASRHKHDMMDVLSNFPQKLPRYCIEVDGSSLETDSGKLCDENVSITSDELGDDSILSEANFDLTRGLYSNSVWNSNNHIIFMLCESNRDNSNVTDHELLDTKAQHLDSTVVNEDAAGKYVFCFKFFWRFFRGLKTVICDDTRCDRFDPFEDKIVSYYSMSTEAYFDFSWSDMHGKTIGVLVNMVGGSTAFEDQDLWRYWESFYYAAQEHIKTSLNCHIKYLSTDSMEYPTVDADDKIEFDMGQKFGVQLHGVYLIKILREVNSLDLEYSVCLDTATLSILTPHSTLVPQYLLIFRTFSPTVWTFIIITTVAFVSMQCIFQFSQREIFRSFYSEREISTYESTSACLTVFSYLICGSPPTLLLGRFFTGRILFVIFSFATIILSTLFFSGATTLLTKEIQNPEIDTLEDLAKAGIFIQTMNVEDASRFLAHFVPEWHGTIAPILTQSLDDLASYIYSEAPSHIEIVQWLACNELNATIIASKLQTITENVRTVTETDAFIKSVPHAMTSKKSVNVYAFLRKDERTKFHVVQEGLMTYPVLFAFSRSSFLFDKVNDIFVRFLETGHTVQFYEQTSIFRDFTEFDRFDDQEPRPYDLKDLRTAFISLFIGWFISFITFVTELFLDFFRNPRNPKIVSRIKKFFRF